jgi:hypothetical protein
MTLSVWPCTVKAAARFVAATHRHLPKLQGGLFATSVVDSDRSVVGVGVAGNPARVWQGTGRFVITRIAVCPGHHNACTMLYGALCRAGKALGYTEAWTYTLPEEPGTSLIAANFTDKGVTAGGEHDRPSRRRAPAKRPDQKRRWCRVLREATQ